MEKQLADLFGDSNLLTSLRQLPRDPALPTSDVSRPRAPARHGASPALSAPPRRCNSARSTSSSPQKRQSGYHGTAGESVALSSHEKVPPRDVKDSAPTVPEQATGLVSNLLKRAGTDLSVS